MITWFFMSMIHFKTQSHVLYEVETQAQSLRDTEVVTQKTQNSKFGDARVVFCLTGNSETKGTGVVTHRSRISETRTLKLLPLQCETQDREEVNSSTSCGI